MILIWVIAGAIVAGSFHGVEGVLPGAVLGYLLGTLWAVTRRVRDLESALAEMKRESAHAHASSVSERIGAPSAGVAEEWKLPHDAPEEPLSGGAETSPLVPPDVTAPEMGKFSPHMGGVSPESREGPGRFNAMAESTFVRLRSFAREAVDRYVLGGSLVVKVGVVVLFFGVAFLLKYASERDYLPIEARLAGAAAGGVALLVIGWKLRLRRAAYGLALQGGGVGVLTLTVFASFRLYGLVPPPLAFAILVGLAVLSAALAVLQNSQSMALLGVAGGFLAPVLTSTGSGSHVALFSFYGLLNASILAVAWFKAWRPLNLVGFLFTFTLGSTWGYRYYRPDYFATTEPFLILFFVFYVAVSVLFALRQPPRLKGYVDGTLVFGTPLITFSLQSLLVHSYAHGIALSSLAFGIFYLGVAWVLVFKAPRSMRMLSEAFLAVGVVFGTITIPLALDNRWTAMAWALEGSAMLWIGIRQDRLLARWAGIVLQLGAGLALMDDVKHAGSQLPVLNGSYLSCVTVSVAGLFSSWYLHINRDAVRSWEPVAGVVLGAWGLLWWYWAGWSEISTHVPSRYDLGSVVLFLALSSLAWDRLEKRLNWPLLVYPSLGLLPVLALVALAASLLVSHPLAKGGLVAWPVALAVHYAVLRRHDEGLKTVPSHLLHGGGLWLMTWIITWELSWVVIQWVGGSGTWGLIAWGLAPSAVVLFVQAFGARLSWPLSTHFRTYLTTGLAPIALFAWGWLLSANLSNTGDPRPLSYFPIVNPLDVTTFVVLGSLVAWIARLRKEVPDAVAMVPRWMIATGLAASFFLWMNAALVRTLHFWGGVGFSSQAMLRSVLFQASTSILWSATALGIMVLSTRRRMRTPWLVGAGLLSVVVVKLFTVDLSSSGTIERIVSFIGVGILLLIVGYFSPVPPRKGKEGAAS
jgi:uncharacterized membrane protein